MAGGCVHDLSDHVKGRIIPDLDPLIDIWFLGIQDFWYKVVTDEVMNQHRTTGQQVEQD